MFLPEGAAWYAEVRGAWSEVIHLQWAQRFWVIIVFVDPMLLTLFSLFFLFCFFWACLCCLPQHWTLCCIGRLLYQYSGAKAFFGKKMTHGELWMWHVLLFWEARG